MVEAMTLLEIRNLSISFTLPGGIVPALSGLDLELDQADTLGLVGESGCGKTVTGLSIMGLVPVPPGRVSADLLRFEGRELNSYGPGELRALRGRRMAMIFQDPMTALNPVLSVGDQVAEVYRIHQGLGARSAREAAVAMMEKVRIPAARRRYDEFPHRLSGGMRQRIMIAMALACGPALLIADEPTTALDVTIQARILDLLEELQASEKMAVILISHNLGVVARICRRVMVMYAGQMVEEAPTGALLGAPAHPYTMGLLGSLPDLGADTGQPLVPIPGQPPPPGQWPPGCRFSMRCPQVEDICRRVPPPLVVLDGGLRRTRCHLAARGLNLPPPRPAAVP